ncbi:palmitoyltransferase ZDHHC12 [Ambystoma mexicanum]|uniref:palmitoyltransferase ZDHHC12 n=1 Tax=Ambystoma mexicanum TaxID=8296 RepID=UPI0037E748D5
MPARDLCPSGLLVRAGHTALTWGVCLVLLHYRTDLRSQEERGELLHPLAFVLLVLCSVMLYFAVSLMDPGYVLSDSEMETLVKSDLQQDAIHPPSKALHLRRCGYCMLQQPMRARHCQSCHHCVRRYDHHCPWIGNCVGERNHPLFVLYLGVQLVVLFWALQLAWSGFHGEAPTWDWLRHNAVLLAAFLTVAIFTMVVILLLVSHLYLVSCNVTTWEFMSHHRISYLKHCDMETNPFDKGIVCNLWVFFCRCRAVAWEGIYFQHGQSPV